jgi:hypothetical protein
MLDHLHLSDYPIELASQGGARIGCTWLSLARILRRGIKLVAGEHQLIERSRTHRQKMLGGTVRACSKRATDDTLRALGHTLFQHCWNRQGILSDKGAMPATANGSLGSTFGLYVHLSMTGQDLRAA